MKKYFLNFFLHFENLNKILDTLEKNMSLRGYLFLKLQTAKSALTSMPKKPRLRTLMESQCLGRSETLLKSA